jgi:hypothetical protein
VGQDYIQVIKNQHHAQHAMLEKNQTIIKADVIHVQKGNTVTLQRIIYVLHVGQDYIQVIKNQHHAQHAMLERRLVATLVDVLVVLIIIIVIL